MNEKPSRQDLTLKTARRFAWLGACLLLIAAALPGSLWADNAKDNAEPESALATVEEGSAAPQPSEAGVKIFIDPKTGQLVAEPTTEQRQALDQEISWQESLAKDLEIPEEKLSPFELSNGGVGVYVGGRFASSLLLHRHEDGSWVLGCAAAGHEEHHLSAGPTTPPALEEK